MNTSADGMMRAAYDAIKQPPQSGVSVDRAVQPLLSGDQVSVGQVEQDMIRPRIFRNPQRRHRTVTSSARCAARHEATDVRQQATGQRMRPPTRHRASVASHAHR